MDHKSNPAKTETATFAGGCFWCMQAAFDLLPGVLSTKVGYSGGSERDANYESVSSGETTHLEAIQVSFDPSKIAYERLLQEFWENIDPTQADGQFADRGTQYLTAIFYASEEQKLAAQKSKEALDKSGKFAKPIATQILPAKPFYVAEDYHQGYYKKNSGHYKAYAEGSGRKGFIKKTWGKE